MAAEPTAPGKQSNPYLLPISLTVAGLLARLAWAHSLFLNADEALHFLLSQQPSLALTYKASLTTVHPPLLIVLLHYWSWAGASEFALRLPSVMAGTAFCWLMYLWLERVTNRETALIGLSLLLFCPALIYVSAEIRQYALLMFFLAASLYCLECALQENSSSWMLLSFLSLLLGISTHYSSLIFALASGIYALIRLRGGKTSLSVSITWVVGELAALALVAFYVVSHVVPLERVGFPQTLADSYLRGSIFHRGEDHVLPFILRSNIKVFHYLFSQGAVGVLGLLLFLLGVIFLFRDCQSGDSRQPTPRQLAWLLILPFLVNCATAVGGTYPYGGTRHNSYLAGFAMSAVAIAIARWRPSRLWAKPLALTLGLAICNFTVLPGGVYMKPRNQRIAFMRQAMSFVGQSVPKGSIIVTDLEGGLALSYYLCHSYALQFQPPFQPFYQSGCGDYQLISQDPRLWIFRAQTFATDMQTLQRMYKLDPQTKVWLFQAGFVVDKEPDLRAVLRQYGCMQPHEFGQNIFLCQMTLGNSISY